MAPFHTGDPVADILVRGEARTVEEAEELYIERHLEELPDLIQRLPADELRKHPLVVLLLAHGSRPWEDAP